MKEYKSILDEIKLLEKKLLDEIHEKKKEYFYNIHKNKVCFDKDVKKKHKKLATGIFIYLINAHIPTVLTAPAIYLCIFPAFFLDAVISLYQFLCFPIYKIPKVKRRQYIIMDRQYLAYLNFIEKINCIYCAYFNGLMAYVSEIAGRTEQFFCPIKHAKAPQVIHSRYKLFLDFGNAKEYRKKLKKIEEDFKDIK